MRIDRRWALSGFSAALAAGTARNAFAQEHYPTRPIRIIVPSTAGGPYDVTARVVADYVSRKYGWTIAVENRPGASGIVGVVAAKQALPDGYTLVVPSSATHGSEPAFNHNPPYDPYTDLAPIILLARGALVLLVGKQMPVNSVADSPWRRCCCAQACRKMPAPTYLTGAWSKRCADYSPARSIS